MKKIYALFFCSILMIAVATAAVIEMPVAPAIAHMGTMIIGGGVPSGDDESSCYSGTYLMSYDGDHDSGTTYACYDSGNSSEDATANNADSVSSDYVECNTIFEDVTWTITGDITNLDDVGTLFVSFQTPDDSGGATGTCEIIQIYYDADNYITVHLTSGGRAYGISKSDGADSATYTGTSCSNDDNWKRLAYSWDADVGHNISCVSIGNGESWENEDADSVAAWASDPTDVSIGTGAHLGYGVNNKIRVKDLIIVNSYKASDPLYP